RGARKKPSPARRAPRTPDTSAALRESEARYRELFQKATAPMATFSLDGRFTDVNQAYVEQLGFTREELIGQSLTIVLTPAGIALAADRQRLAAAGEPLPSTFEIETATKRGDIHLAQR